MARLRQFLRSTLVFAVPGFLLGCDPSPQSPAPAARAEEVPTGLTPRQEAAYRYVLSLGFPADSIKIAADRIRVEDMVFRTDVEYPDPGAGPALAKRSQYYYTTLGFFEHRTRHIKVRVESSANSEISRLEEALKILNSTHANVFFKRVTTTDQDILLRSSMTDCPVNRGAWAQMPSGGGPGSLVNLCTTTYNPLADWRKVWVLTHEFMHTIGFLHNYEYGPNGELGHPGPGSGGIVTGTPIYNVAQPFSVLRPDVPQSGVTQDNFLSYNDHKAVQFYHPYRAGGRAPDLDGDGRSDLVLIEPSGFYYKVSWRLSVGDQLMYHGTLGTIPVEEAYFMTGDLNGDNRSDLIYGKQIYDEIAVRYWSNGTFGSEVNLGAWDMDRQMSFHTLDYDGNGRDDILIVDPRNQALRLRLSTASGLAPETVINWGDFAGQFFVGDFNGDNREDIFCAIRPAEINPYNSAIGPHTVNVLLANGTSLASGIPVQAVCGDCFGHISWGGWYGAADFNADNKDDIYFYEPNLGTGAMYVGLSNGSSLYSVKGPSYVGRLGSQFMVGDINGDNRWDIFSANRDDNSLKVLWSNSADIFYGPTDLVPAGHFGKLSLGAVYY